MDLVSSNAQGVRHRVSWTEARFRLATMLDRLPHSRTTATKVYGIPRGGSAVAAMLVDVPGIHLVDTPERADFFVDDIIDSGRTAERYAQEFGKQTLALFNRSSSECPAGWIAFPWDAVNDAGPEDGVVRLLQYIGEDPKRDGLRDTPGRVARALREMTRGYEQDPTTILARTFVIDCDEMVVLSGIRFSSLCEHHLLPFHGVATVGYIPKKSVVGISKLARVVECFAQRLQVQERLTSQIAQAIQSELDPVGVGVVVTAHHSCIGCRGAKQADADMITSSLLGQFREDARTRAEFLELARREK
jgi:GTP cyclohydrolase I